MRSTVPASLAVGLVLLGSISAAAGPCPHCVDYRLGPSSEPLGTLDVTDEPFDLDLHDDIVYLAISHYEDPNIHELITVDVTDPATPLLLDTADSPWGHRSVDVEGNHAYVAFPHLAKFDVTDPSAIEMVGFLDFAVFPGETARKVEVDGDLAFVITDLEGQTAERLRIIDVSGDPGFLGSVTFTYPLNDVAVRGSYVYAVGFFGVHLVDVSAPENPILLETLSTANQATGIELAGDIALVSVSERPLQILDISDPASPETIGAGPILGSIAVADELVYARHASSLALYDLSDPTTLTQLGALGGVFAFSFDVEGCRVATVNWFIGDELRMFPTHCPATTAAGEQPHAPVAARTTRSVPNPFRSEATLEYELPEAGGPVEITIYNVAGRLIRRLDAASREAAGGSASHRVVWDGRDADGRRSAPGTYYYRIASSAGALTGQVTLLR